MITPYPTLSQNAAFVRGWLEYRLEYPVMGSNVITADECRALISMLTAGLDIERAAP